MESDPRVVFDRYQTNLRTAGETSRRSPQMHTIEEDSIYRANTDEDPYG